MTCRHCDRGEWAVNREAMLKNMYGKYQGIPIEDIQASKIFGLTVYEVKLGRDLRFWKNMCLWSLAANVLIGLLWFLK